MAFSRSNYRVGTLVTTDTYVTSVRAVPSSPAIAVVHRDCGDDRDAAVGGRRHFRATTTAKPVSQAPQFAQQPLTGLGGGETVREIHQDTPFSMVALTAEDLTGTSAQVRAKKSDGSWGPWYEAETLEGVGPELRRLRAAPSRYSSAAPPRCRSRSPARRAPHPPWRRTKAPAKPGLGYVPANVEQPFAQNINAVLISPPQAPVDTLPLPIRRHAARPATQHHQPRTVGRRRGDAVREHGVRQRDPGRGRAPHRGQQ